MHHTIIQQYSDIMLATKVYFLLINYLTIGRFSLSKHDNSYGTRSNIMSMIYTKVILVVELLTFSICFG